jgi:hypothetical protein
MRMDPVLQKLHNVLGDERAHDVIRNTLAELGLAELRSPDDRLRFGSVLVRQGGILEAIGRAIKVQAILHGAKEK